MFLLVISCGANYYYLYKSETETHTYTTLNLGEKKTHTQFLMGHKICVDPT